MAREEREHYYFMSHSQYPRWCNKIWRIKGMFETKFISVAFFSRTLHGECKLFHFFGREFRGWVCRGLGSSACNVQVQTSRVPGSVEKKRSQMRYPQLPGHPALFSFVICFVGSLWLAHKKGRQICNAIMLAWISELIICDWKRRFRRLWTRFGVRWNGESRI